MLFQTGHQVHSPSGDLLSSAGRADITAFFEQGDSRALDLLCEALS